MSTVKSSSQLLNYCLLNLWNYEAQCSIANHMFLLWGWFISLISGTLADVWKLSRPQESIAAFYRLRDLDRLKFRSRNLWSPQLCWVKQFCSRLKAGQITFKANDTTSVSLWLGNQKFLIVCKHICSIFSSTYDHNTPLHPPIGAQRIRGGAIDSPGEPLWAFELSKLRMILWRSDSLIRHQASGNTNP